MVFGEKWKATGHRECFRNIKNMFHISWLDPKPSPSPWLVCPSPIVAVLSGVPSVHWAANSRTVISKCCRRCKTRTLLKTIREPFVACRRKTCFPLQRTALLLLLLQKSAFVPWGREAGTQIGFLWAQAGANVAVMDRNFQCKRGTPRYLSVQPSQKTHSVISSVAKPPSKQKVNEWNGCRISQRRVKTLSASPN